METLIEKKTEWDRMGYLKIPAAKHAAKHDGF